MSMARYPGRLVIQDTDGNVLVSVEIVIQPICGASGGGAAVAGVRSGIRNSYF